MDNFIVSARKYRPDTFDTVIGQGTVTATLKNAIATNHLAQAYLFCGPRGVGKTTCARILAKTINCSQITDRMEACNKCESCMAFNESRSFNIHELDAASNNSVEDMRNLIDQVRVPPQIGQYSIYIIDEVHMLSASAFNTFLKTLEETPKHAIFILATTDKHKILPTILSRCQLFDFNRISLEDMVNQLSYIAKEEDISTEPDALHVIAQKADGAMRDALSIFDQMVSFGGNQIKYEDVIENLNVLDFEFYFSMTNAFLSGDSSTVFLLLDEIIAKGFDPHHFITGMGGHFRDLLVSKDQKTIELLQTSENLKDRYLKQSQACSSDFLFKGLKILSETDIHFKAARNQRLHTELCLLRLCRLSTPEPIDKEEKFETKNEVVRIKKAPSTENEINTPSQAKPVSSSTTPHEVPNTSEPEPIQKDPQVKEGHKSYIPQTTSIKDALKGNISPSQNSSGPLPPEEEKAADSKIIKEPEHLYSSDDLKKSWLEFSRKIKDSKPRLANTLNSQLPEMNGPTGIIVSMENANQLDDFNKYLKTDILAHLRKHLMNEDITLEVALREKPDEERKPYTQEEKYKFLNKKNPNLNVLKNQLGLDLE